MTKEQAIDMLQRAVNNSTGFTIGGIADRALGIAAGDAVDLQTKLDELMKSNGVFTDADAKAVQDLLDKQKQERRHRNWLRVRNTVFAGSALLLGGYTIYLTFKHKKK
jgi:hypothetical protein